MAKTAPKNEVVQVSPHKTKGQARMVAQFKSAKSVGVPIIGITTPDQFKTLSVVCEAVAPEGEPPVVKVAWDVVRGFRAINQRGLEWVSTIPEQVLQDCKMNPVKALEVAFDLGVIGDTALDDGMLFIHNAQRWIADPTLGGAVVQGLCNLRDEYKSNGRAIVLLAPSLDLPTELSGDVVIIDEPLPQGEELAAIIREVFEYAKDGTAAPTDEVVARSVEAVQGLPAFQAEQVTAMSIRKAGIDLDGLWEQKRKLIEQTPGLSVSRDGITFADIGGCAVIKEFLTKLFQGKKRPNAVVFIDEIEKMIAGAGGDTSGTSQDQLGTILSEMDKGATGVIFVGHPGGGKSAIAKGTGNSASVPTIKLDLGAAKGGIVGQSEQQIRAALKTVGTVSNGQALWIATCNSMASLPTELIRRFTFGTFFFDLPTKEEREVIWGVHRAKYGIDAKDPGVANDAGWTGAEIEKCCVLASRLNESLDYASGFVVPISVSAKDRIEGLRTQAEGNWLDVATKGPDGKPQTYRRPQAVADQAAKPRTGRRVAVTE